MLILFLCMNIIHKHTKLTEQMDSFISLYQNLKKLREGGIRMKEIAEEVNVASSVLSSLYSSVLPTYVQLVHNGKDSDSALEEALQLVNNVSRRKLVSCVDELLQRTTAMDYRLFTNAKRCSFWSDMEKESIKNYEQANIYAGVYRAYSRSSYCDGMKIEPYMIATTKDSNYGSNIFCQNWEGKTYVGSGVFFPGQCGYLLFNEQQKLQLTLKTIHLQLPLLEQPVQMKGIYLTHDYNQNPIARRILFIRESEEVPFEEFCQRKTLVIPKQEISEQLMPYYNYTCQKEDYIRSFAMASPQNDENNLKLEKELLKLV